MHDSTEKLAELKWYQRIGNRIILTAIVAAVLPLVIISGNIGFKVRNDLIWQTIFSQKQLSETIQHGIESLFRNYYRQIDSLARLPAIQGMKPELQNGLIHEFLEQRKIFYSCSVYSKNGKIVSVAIRNRKDNFESAPEDFSAAGNGINPLKKAFDSVLATGNPSFTSFVSPVFQEKMLFILVPVFDFVDSSEVVGVVSCSISLSDPGIHEIICGYPIQDDDILVLTDKLGCLISWQGRIPDNFAGIEIPAQLASNPKGLAVTLQIASDTYLGTLSEIPGVDGYLLSARPWGKAMEFLNQLLLDLALVLAVALVIAVAAGFVLARTLADGINSLLDGIREVGRGVVSHRVEIIGEDELAEAGKAFNEMVDTLEKHRMIEDIWKNEWESTRITGDSHGEDH
ncbi:MAG: hypothetical protein Kow0029_02940 [Candidatus Rifleibacteriota bacterium]